VESVGRRIGRFDSVADVCAVIGAAALFADTFATAGIQRHAVPYGTSFLSVSRLAPVPGASRGTVLIHGGFDSLIEEFYCFWSAFAEAGFTILAFDRPGQGASLHRYVVAAGRRDPGLFRRVRRHIGGDIVWLVPVYPRLLNASIGLRMRIVPVIRHAIVQALHVQRALDQPPIAAVRWIPSMNADHLSSERVTQDLLICVSERDRFPSPKLADLQIAALTNARSITKRTSTRAEHAENHCRIGNVGVALDRITSWLIDRTESIEGGDDGVH
jgi:hypothetical protein